MSRRRHTVILALAIALPVVLLATPVSANGDPAFSVEAPGRWVALGDSYQAGTGTGDYYPDSGECRRSPASHPKLIDTDGTLRAGGQKVPFTFVACDGATTDALYAGMKGEPPQVNALTSEVSHVTLGIGGNDLGFSSLLEECLMGYVRFQGPCDARLDAKAQAAFDRLTRRDQPGNLNRVEWILSDIRARAPAAKLFLLTYPRFFSINGGKDGTSRTWLPWKDRCNYILVSDQLWINNWIRRLDNYLVAAAVADHRATPVDIYQLSEGREICPDGDVPLDERYVHGLVGSILPPNTGVKPESFHPKKWGYQTTAERLKEDLCAPSAPSHMGGDTTPLRMTRDITVSPGQTVRIPVTMAGGPGVGISTSWKQGNVETRLRDPDGRLWDRRGLRGRVVRTPDGISQEDGYVPGPRAGGWTIELHGAAANRAPMTVRLAATEIAKRNVPPTARMTLRRNGDKGNEFVFDASRSADSDGRIKTYLWELGDGTLLRGKRLTHTFAERGTYTVTLTTIDDRGELDIVTSRPITVGR
ncbi:PKD domain-containing protein [Actinomadura sp. KC06]|uniref:PKD domain-containing protein n=1 Tax=Actinomadura sp. KC06 TaxID=2530369 RepID=UPI001052520F|nr:PKD domain-containing protein [Actinomadura sp. KC06]TDD34665.1 PKD domain-containing protein [Actinomadura sp. KC06]